jgi:hypothetical protein
MALANALRMRGATAEADAEIDQAIALQPPTTESERIWTRSRAPVVVAISIAAFLAYHALTLLRPRFTDWRVAVLLLALTFVLVVAVLLGLAIQRRRLSQLTSAERLQLAVEARRRRLEGRGQYAFHLLVLAVVIGGLSLITSLYAIGHRATTEVQVGDCFSSDRMVSIDTISTIPCILPHDFEVFAVLREPSPPGAPYPGIEALHEQLRSRCKPLYADYVGVPFGDEAPTTFDTFIPEESFWRLDIRTEFCALQDWRDRQMMGSRRAT